MAVEVHHTLGIDLASQPETTAACLLAWHPDRVEVRYLERDRDVVGRLDDERLLALMLGEGWPGQRPSKIGIDAPLGWPVAFVAALVDPDGWPLVDEVETVALVRRRADRWVHERTGKVPLSVSTDRIAYPAMRAQRLLRRFREATGAPVDRSGLSGAVCEVYPDVGVSHFGLRPDGARRVSYKGAAGTAAREVLLARLLQRAPWLALSPEQQVNCVAFDDFFDALIAALITRSVQLGLSEPPPPELAAEAAQEGWIHLPRPGGLADLAPQAGPPSARPASARSEA
jgi:hypothetical protein